MYGYDISNYQSVINIPGIHSDFVIQKASEGNWYTDPTLTRHANAVLKSGKLLGLYHFSDGQSVESEVDHFIRCIKPWIGKATFWLDFEGNALKMGTGYAKRWLELFWKKTGIQPGIYMMLSAENGMNWSGIANHYPLWIAQYNNYNITGYSARSLYGNLHYWNHWSIFQNTSTGRLAGYYHNLDLNHAVMTHDEWRKMAHDKTKHSISTSSGDEFEMSWHPQMEYDTIGHVKVNLHSGADIYDSVDFKHKVGKAKYASEHWIREMKDGAFRIGKNQWLSGEDVVVKLNPLAVNSNAHDMEFVITSDKCWTQNELSTKAKGIKYLKKGSHWKIFGRKGQFIRVGSKADGEYVNADRGLVKL